MPVTPGAKNNLVARYSLHNAPDLIGARSGGRIILQYFNMGCMLRGIFWISSM